MAERRRPMRRGRGMPGEKPKNFKGAIKALFAYMGKYKIALTVVMLFAIGSTIFQVIGPKILGNATTELFSGLVAKISGIGNIHFGKREKQGAAAGKSAGRQRYARL